MAAHVGEPPTVATDETLSQPSTSAGTNEDAVMQDGEAEAERNLSSDSDASIGWGDYEHRKDVIVKKLVICEQMMARVKVTAKFTRLKDYEKRKETIRNRTDSEYLSRVAAMEREMQKERDKQETQYSLELAALERANEGEEDFINRGYRDRMQYRKDQLIYDAKLKLNKVLERLWREDEIRSDARIFVGEDVPDEWMDEFVKTYVDELEERENSEEAIRERNLKRYRMEACESLDTGQSLSGILDSAMGRGQWGNRSSLFQFPPEVYAEEEKKRVEREKRKQREKMIDERVKHISHKKIGRFFGNDSLPPRSEITLDDLDPYDEETIDDRIAEERSTKKIDDRRMEEEEEEELPQSSTTAVRVNGSGSRKRGVKSEEELRRRELEKRLSEVKRQYEEEKGRVEESRRMEEEKWRREEEELREWERGEKERQARIWRSRLVKLEQEMSEESCSDDEKQDLASTVRQGVRAILLSQGRAGSKEWTRNSKRVGRLKNSLRMMLEMKREFSADPELKDARDALMGTFVTGMRKERREVFEDSDTEEHLVGEMSLEEHVRDSALVNGVVAKIVKRPMCGGALMDREGRAKGAVERERKRREIITNQFLAMKKKFREKYDKKKKGAQNVENGRGWDDEKRGRRKAKKKEYEEEIETIYVDEDEEIPNRKTSTEKELSEKERIEKEQKLREIRAVIEGRDPSKIDEQREEKKEKEKEGEEEEVEIVEEDEEKKREMDGIMKTKKKRKEKKKNGRTTKKFSQTYSSGSSEDEEYGSKANGGYGSVPAYRLAARPQPRMRLQLSQERIMRDLYRSGALRQRESYGEHIEKVDNERRQRLLSSLPSSSTGEEGGNRMGLLSPRSQRAIEEMPEEAMASLTKKERRALLEGLPSTSKEESPDEDEKEESDEELSEGWELEEENVEREVKEEEEDDEEEESEEYDSVDDEYEEEYEKEYLDEEEEETEESRRDEMWEGSPPGAVGGSFLLHETTTKEKKSDSTQGMNGFSRTGTTTVI